MATNVYKDLLTRLGCLADGRFICPPDLREVIVIVSHLELGVPILISPGQKAPGSWSYTDDFIIQDRGSNRRAYFGWDGVVAVYTNPV